MVWQISIIILKKLDKTETRAKDRRRQVEATTSKMENSLSELNQAGQHSQEETINTRWSAYLLNAYTVLNQYMLSKHSLEYMRYHIDQYYGNFIFSCEYYTNSIRVMSKETNLILRETYSREDLLNSICSTISIHSEWLGEYVKRMPYFEMLSQIDLHNLINENKIQLVSFKSVDFISETECFRVSCEKILVNRQAIASLFGTDLDELDYSALLMLSELNLTRAEKALIYPFILSHTNGSFV